MDIKCRISFASTVTASELHSEGTFMISGSSEGYHSFKYMIVHVAAYCLRVHEVPEHMISMLILYQGRAKHKSICMPQIMGLNICWNAPADVEGTLFIESVFILSQPIIRLDEVDLQVTGIPY